MENFGLLINKAKESEDKIAKRAIRQYGSAEKYTEEMKYNLEHFQKSWILNDEAKKIVQQSDELYAKLTANLAVDCTSILYKKQNRLKKNKFYFVLSPYYTVLWIIYLSFLCMKREEENKTHHYTER